MDWLNSILILFTDARGGGSEFYHLLTLLVLMAALFVALDHWRRDPEDSPTRRIALAAAGMLAMRLVLVALALSAAYLPESFSPAGVVPPLERAFNLATIILLLWALLAPRERSTGADALAALGLTLAFAGTAASITYWYPQGAAGRTYNNSDDEYIWTIAQSVLLVIGLVWEAGRAVARRDALEPAPDWAPGVVIFGVLFAGNMLELFLPAVDAGSPLIDANIPAAVRLAQVYALPLFAAYTWRHVLTRVRASAEAAAANVGTRSVEVLAAARLIGSTLDEHRTVDHVAMATANAIGCDVAAVALPAPGNPEEILLAAVYDRAGHAYMPSRTFPLAEFPPIRNTIQRKRPTLLEPGPAYSDRLIAQIFDQLSMAGSGPLLIQPIGTGDTNRGALLVGNPRTGRPLSAEDRAIAGVLGERAAVALGLSQQYEVVARRAEQLSQTLRRQEAGEHETSGDDLEAARAESDDARRDAQRFAQQLTELQSQLERERQNTRELRILLAQQNESGTPEPEVEAEVEEPAAPPPAEVSDHDARLAQLRSLAASRLQMLGQPAPAEPAAAPAAQPTPGAAESALPGAPAETVEERIAWRDAQILELTGMHSQAVKQAAEFEERLADLSEITRELARELDDAHAQIRHMADPAEVARMNDELAHVQLELVATRTAVEELSQERQRLLAQLEGRPVVAAREGEHPNLEVINALVQELRTPMTSITGYTDLLLGESVGILGALQRKFLQRIRGNVERLSSLMDDLIRLTSIETGQLHIEPQAVRIDEVLQEAVGRLSAQVQEKGLTVRLDVDRELPPVSADPDALYQVFVQLLNNAVQASHSDSEIRLVAQREAIPQSIAGTAAGDAYALVTVCDTGGGIAPEDQPRVFSRIYRADNPLIAGVGDTGVGLSIAKVLVEAQGGRIWLESIMGAGSTFKVLLPLRPSSNGHEKPA